MVLCEVKRRPNPTIVRESASTQGRYLQPMVTPWNPMTTLWLAIGSIRVMLELLVQIISSIGKSSGMLLWSPLSLKHTPCLPSNADRGGCQDLHITRKDFSTTTEQNQRGKGYTSSCTV